VLRAHHAPGHTPGSLVLEYGDLLFCGDLLLNVPAVLRRLPGTDDAQLDASRRHVLAAFAENTRVLPGHGRPRTIAELRRRFDHGEL
jgi:glyoxylase-like metal-dependent hydrolase (beta-lactamase superfamily II)